MLSLKQALGLNSIRPLGGWQPSDEGSRLIAWYKNKTGITLNGSDVSRWSDSAGSNHMVQTVPSKQPEYIASTGALRFVTADVQSLQTTGTDIELSGTFTIGIKLYPTLNNVIVLGDNTTSNEFFKITNSTQLRFKTDGSSVDITVNDGDLTADNYLVITRNASDLVTLYINGVAQTDTETLAGTANIDAIGVRATDANPYDGTISEVQIFDAESTALTNNVNSYLSEI